MSPVPPPHQSGPSDNVMILAVVMIFASVVASITTMAVAVEDGARLESLATQLLAAVPATLGVLVLLAKLHGVGRQVDFLANGGTDAKVRAAIGDVVDPALLRDDAHDQIAVDRAVRDRQALPSTPPAAP